jgi:iron complex outermembrane recepter protein
MVARRKSSCPTLRKNPLNLIEVILAQGSDLALGLPKGSRAKQLTPCIAHLPSLLRIFEIMMATLSTYYAPYAYSILFAALAASHGNAFAQAIPVQAQTTVVVTGRAEPAFDATDTQLGMAANIKDAPQSLNVLTQALLKEAGATSLSRTLALDASLSDTYNAVGYFESVQIRGFVLDSVNNYQRNGLPTLNYAPFAAENKSQVEVLKGVSGLQAAVSAPGGLVNYRVSQPVRDAVTELSLSATQGGGKLVHADVSRADEASGIALRVNALHETIRPAAFSASGSRSLLSADLTWAASAQTKLEVEVEWQRKSQLEQPGFGLLYSDSTGAATILPRIAINDANAIDPRTNLNAQPWSLPYEQRFFTGAVHVSHAVSDATQLSFALQSQRLITNDRVSFADGSSYAYPGAAANGDIDIYDYRSENERRTLHVAQVGITHRATFAGMPHRLQAQLQSYQQRFDPQPKQAYNYVGTSNEFAPVITPPAPSTEGYNTANAERVTSLTLADAISLTPQATLYIGLKSSRLARSSTPAETGLTKVYSQQIATPNVGITWRFMPSLTGYMSAGQGIESDVVPNRAADFANAGEALPALKSRQTELGIKWQASPRMLATAAVFDISKPYAQKDEATQLMIAGAKQARHKGLELNANGAVNPQLSITASAMWLNARITKSLVSSELGGPVTNVAPFTATLFADYKLADVKGLGVNTRLRYDAAKPVFADPSISKVELPAALQWDLGLRYRQVLSTNAITWRVSVENLLNKVYWKEVPTTPWGGVYLFPNTPRRVNVAAQLAL